MRGLDAIVGTSILVPALLVAGACSGPSESAESEVTKLPLVRTAALAPRTVTDRMSLPADVVAWRQATLSAEVAGVVESLAVDTGDEVALGQVLATVDRRTTEIALAEAEALHRQSVQQFERAEKLFERRSVTETQLVDATTNRDVAKTRLASARLQLEKSTLTAPWTGRVSQRFVEKGDYVAPGQPLFEIVDAKRVRARAPVAAADVPWVREGAEVVLRLDAWPDAPLDGVIRRVAPTLDPASRTLEVEAVFENSQGRLRPGLPARLELSRRRYEDALVVPWSALVDFAGRKVVYVVEGGRAVRRDVEPGPVVEGDVIVRAGVFEGDRVIVDGLTRISDGQEVEEDAATEPAS